jgi:hypothetical protein
MNSQQKRRSFAHSVKEQASPRSSWPSAVFLQALGLELGFELQLTNATLHVEELLELTRLDSVLEMTRRGSVGERIGEYTAP